MTNAEAIVLLKILQEPEPWTPQLNYAGYSALDMAISALEKQEQKKTLTNADRIRSMTNEELSEWLLYKARASCTKLFDGKCRTETNYTCEKCVEAWLKQEVKDGY